MIETLLASLIPALVGGMFSAGQTGMEKSRAASDRSESARQFDLELDLQKRAMEEAKRATEEENRRRQIEASFRAGKLEDVANMFMNLGQSGGTSDMMRLAGELASPDSYADIRKSAMRELEQSSGALNAMMAQAGLRGSGFSAGQQRGLASDVLMGLSRDIAGQRSANLQAAGNLFGQATQLDLSRLGNIANLFSDEAFGANAPLASGYGMFGANQGLEGMVGGMDTIRRRGPLVNTQMGMTPRTMPVSRVI